MQQELRTITHFLLNDVEIDKGSLSRLSDQIWFPDTITEHRSGQYIELCKTFVIGTIWQTIFDAERIVILTFSNVWNLLCPMRTIAGGDELQFVGDVTHKASLAAINKLGFGVNMLGCKAARWTFTLYY